MLTMTLIFLMIIVGGLTRLTNSGLSITEWELFKGIIPPLNKTTWIEYFELYQKIPQYKIINPTMSLEEFKIIFYWEYAHRILGRFIGLFFLIPLIYFHVTSKLKGKDLIEYYFILSLIVAQGVVGWYMVKSGLVNDVTVSHFRLSMHLTGAIIILVSIFWKVKCLSENKIKTFFNFTKEKIPYFILIFLIFIQIIFGAFVSGLDAGKIYQTWPLMGNSFFPDDYIFKEITTFIDFNNHSLVQFYHRNFAYLILLYITLLTFYILNSKNKFLYKPITLLLIVVFAQAILGVFTLISNLNIVIAAAHQITSVILVLTSVNLYFSAIK